MKNKDYNKFRKYGYPVFWILLYLIFFLITPFEISFKEWMGYNSSDFMRDLIGSFIYAVIIFESGIQITLLLNRFLPWEIAPARRVVIQLVIQIIAITIVFTSLYFLPFFQDPVVDWVIFRQALVLGIIFSVLITACFTAEYFFRSYMETKIQSARFQQKAAEAELEALKNHIDPHFLFNNFSVLTSLIEEDSGRATNFVAELSTVYRYVLHTRKQETITLQGELTFLNHYYYLYQIRYEDAIRFTTTVSDAAKDRKICSMTLQLLFENAIKHNSITKEKPLCIHITQDDENWIVVSNNKQPKQTKEDGAGMGLPSIRERYAHAGNRLPVITETSTHFTVKIPLL